MKFFVTFMSAVAVSSAANIFLDLAPEEAAKYINNPPFSTPELSARTNVLPPVYDAAQFHGQDGLGAYAYGYKAPESSKVENRQRNGDLNGSYRYKHPGGGNDVKVRYWNDKHSQGFHLEENMPKQVEHTPEVKAARIVYGKAWNEAAYGNNAAAAHSFQNNYQAQPSQSNYQQSTQNYQQGYLAQPTQNYQQGYKAQPTQNYQQGYQAQPTQNYQQGYQAQPTQNYQQGYQAQPTQNYQHGYKQYQNKK